MFLKVIDIAWNLLFNFVLASLARGLWVLGTFSENELLFLLIFDIVFPFSAISVYTLIFIISLLLVF